MKLSSSRWKANFFTGLAVVLPAVVSLALLKWIFGTVSNVTDTLLFFLPTRLTHDAEGQGIVHWYWSLVALLFAILLVSLIGRLTRNYLGKQMIGLMDQLMSSVPLLNKIYSTVKQVNEAFSTSKKSSFKQVVLVEYPRAGLYSVGFVTSEDQPEVAARTGKAVVGVFIPTTPNPTSGFLVMVPEDQLIRLEMSVGDGIKYIISLGAIIPEHGTRPSEEAPRALIPPRP